MKNAVIIGYSGHSYVVIDAILSNGYNLTSYCEQISKDTNPYNLAYLGNENEESVLNKLRDKHVFIGIGNNLVRSAIFIEMTKNKISCPSVVHPRAYVSPMSVLGPGSVVMPGAVINSMSKIGNAVICNSSCIIEHECKIDDYVHIAPGAVLAGNVSVGTKTFVGANAVIRQGLKIGSNVVIGAGAVVTKDIADNTVVYGNPARIR